MKYLNSFSNFLFGRVLEKFEPNDIIKFRKSKTSKISTRTDIPRRKPFHISGQSEHPDLTVYHRTSVSSIDKISKTGFKTGRTTIWGEGIYTCYDLISLTVDNEYNPGSKTKVQYGSILIESQIQSLKDFFILDYDVARIVLGSKYDLISQAQKILPSVIFEKYKNILQKSADIIDTLDKKIPKNKYTSEALILLKDIPQIMDNLRGVIFTNKLDGKVLVSYDSENIAPLRYSEDEGLTWKRFEEKTAFMSSKDNLRKLLTTNKSEDLYTKLKDKVVNLLTKNFGVDFDFTKLQSEEELQKIFNNLQEEEDVWSYRYEKSLLEQISSLWNQRFSYVDDLIDELENGTDEKSQVYYTNLKKARDRIVKELGDFKSKISKQFENIQDDDNYLIEILKKFRLSSEYFSFVDVSTCFNLFINLFKRMKDLGINPKRINDFDKKLENLCDYLLQEISEIEIEIYNITANNTIEDEVESEFELMIEEEPTLIEYTDIFEDYKEKLIELLEKQV